MFSLILSLIALILGYMLYGKFVERVFGPDKSRTTPAIDKADGVDFVPLPTWKVFMIQFLNIAGTGPIFGAIMGAKFGPSAYLWIVLGCIFAGAVHDYLSGMLSVRHGGAGLPEIIGTYLGNGTKKVVGKVLTEDGKIVGTAGVDKVGQRDKIKHRAEFGISILKECWGLGIGRALTKGCIECATAAGYVQLELEAVADNAAALSLYEGVGFREYGRNPEGFLTRGGAWQELVLMRLELT